MRSVRPVVPVVAGFLLLLPAAPRAQELDDDDKRFLNDVRPLILRDEEATFEKLKDKANRLEFQEIFWARRDPDLATPENEFQQQYVKDRATADRRYSVPGASGSATDCGRLFILLGKPDEIAREPGQFAKFRNHEIVHQPFAVVRWPEIWVYKDRPERRIQLGQAAIAFDEECRGGGNLAQQLDRIAATKIVHPNIDYRVGKDGHLVKPADQLAGNTPPRGFFRRP